MRRPYPKDVGRKAGIGADHRPSHSATPKTGHPNTGQMRTEWRYILKRSYLSLLSRFSVFLFYNPETAVHQPPASAPQSPREQLRREVISQSDELRQGRQAGTEDIARLFQSPRRGRKPCWLWPSHPPKEMSVCAVLTSSSAASEGPPLPSQRPGVPTLRDTQSRNKTGPPPCHPVYMRDKITFVQK